MTATTRGTKPMLACLLACLLANSLDGAGEALRILVNEASCIERAQHLQATPYERSAQRVDYANRYKNKTVLTHMAMLAQNPERVMSYFQDRRVRCAA